MPIVNRELLFNIIDRVLAAAASIRPPGRMRTMTLALIISMLAFPVRSQETTTRFMTADELLTLCTSADRDDQRECGGFLQGVSDELNIGRALQNLPACKEPVKLFEVRDVVVQFIRTHPVKSEGAASVANAAMVSAWCPR